MESERGDDEFVGPLEAADPREQIEEIGGVLAKFRSGREEGEVRVKFGGGGVVVARSQMEIAPDAVLIPAHDEGHLGMHLVAHHPVDHVHAGLLQASCPEDVVGLVEAGLELGDRRDLFPAPCGVHKGSHDAGISARAVEGLFNGQHVWICSGLFEKFHYGAEVLIGMVQQDVPLANGGKKVAAIPHGGAHGSEEGAVTQLGGVVPCAERHQSVGIEGPLDPVQIGFGQIEGVEQVLVNFGRGVVVDLQPHGGALSAVLKFLFDGTQKVPGVVLVDVEFAVSGDSEMPVARDAGAREEILEVVPDEVAKEHVFAPARFAGQLDEAGQHLRDLNNREVLQGAALPVHLESEDDVERFVEELRKGVGGINTKRSQNGAHLLMIVVIQPAFGGPLEVRRL